MQATIFISYSSRDQKEAELVCNALESRGFSCWIAFRDVHAGDDFQEAIVAAIERAKAMVLVFTENANNSDEIKKELVLAGQYDVVVMPIRVEDIRPRGAFAYQLATRQWIDLFDDWERGIGRLIERIATVVAACRSTDETTAATEAAARKDETPAPALAPQPGPARTPNERPLVGATNPLASDASRPAEATATAPRRSRRWLLISGAAAATSAVGVAAYWGPDLIESFRYGPEKTIKPGFPSQRASLSPDGRLFASGLSSPNYRWEVWSVETAKPIASLSGFYVLDQLGRFSDDGKWLASRNNNATIAVRDTASGQIRHLLQGHTSEIEDVAFSRDGRWLASGGKDRTIRLWDLRTGQATRTFTGHTDTVNRLAFGTDGGNRLISASYDRTLRFWDVASPKPVKTIAIEPEFVTNITAPPAGPWIMLYVAFERRIRLLNMLNGESKNVRLSGFDAVAAFSPNGKWLALGTESEPGASRSDIALWTADGAALVTKFVGHTRRVEALAFSSDSTRLVSSGGDYTIKVWKLPEGTTEQR
jgi:hypothetical protein